MASKRGGTGFQLIYQRTLIVVVIAGIILLDESSNDSY